MKQILAFFRLIRSLNVFFIVFTQCLFHYSVIVPVLRNAGIQPSMSNRLFGLLVLASAFIAAAGYVINDYFDINIDLINRPERLVVEKIIKRRSAILWHWLLSGIGVSLSFYIGWQLHHTIYLGLANLLCVLLLWLYSTVFKKKLLIGNFVISLLTAWVVFILYSIEAGRYLLSDVDPVQLAAFSTVFKFTVLYGGFAFMITLVREVVKDMEDMGGDARYGCSTLPIVYGIRASKIFVMTWLSVMVAGIALLQFYFIPYNWWLSIAYNFLFILFPLLRVMSLVKKAMLQNDFHRISQWIKFIMFAGICSMSFIYYYG